MESQADNRTFVSQPPDEFMCLICSKVLVDPQLTDCCGQHFCLVCVRRWFEKKGRKECPHCRSKTFTYIVYLPLKRKIDALEVYCPNKSNDCSFITSLDGMEAHTKECGYEKLTCEKGCGADVLRKDMQAHSKNDCTKRATRCKFCRKMGPYDDIITGEHKDICPDYPVGCPHMCVYKNSSQIKRKDLNDHKRVCPFELVECIHCNMKVLRFKLQSHKEDKCPKRRVFCEHCRKFGHYDEIHGAHVTECSEYPVVCPRECTQGKKLKRKDLESHSAICELEPVRCSFFEAGCDTSVPRKDLLQHMESNTQLHLQKCMETQLRMSEDYDKLVTFFKELKGKFDVLNVDHEQLKEEYEQFKKGHNEMKSCISTELKQISVEGSSGASISSAASCIKTIVSPNLTRDNPLQFHIPTLNECFSTLTTWTSVPFTIDEMEGWKLVVTINRDRIEKKSPTGRHSGSRYRGGINYYLDASLYRHTEEHSHLNRLGDYKELQVEIFTPQTDASRNKKYQVVIDLSRRGRLQSNSEIVPGPYGEMTEVFNALSVPIGYCEIDDLSDKMVLLRLL